MSLYTKHRHNAHYHLHLNVKRPHYQSVRNISWLCNKFRSCNLVLSASTKKIQSCSAFFHSSRGHLSYQAEGQQGDDIYSFMDSTQHANEGAQLRNKIPVLQSMCKVAIITSILMYDRVIWIKSDHLPLPFHQFVCHSWRPWPIAVRLIKFHPQPTTSPRSCHALTPDLPCRHFYIFFSFHPPKH